MKKVFKMILLLFLIINGSTSSIYAYSEQSNENYAIVHNSIEQQVSSNEYYIDIDLSKYIPGDTILVYEDGNSSVFIEYVSFTPLQQSRTMDTGSTTFSAGAIPTGTHEIMPHVTKHGVTTSFYMRVRASTNSSGKYSFDFEKLWGFSTNHSGSVKKVNYVKPSSYKAGVNYSGTVGIFGLEEEFNGYFYAEFNTSGNMRVLWHTPY